MEECLLRFNNIKDLIIIDEEHLSIIVELFRQKNTHMINLEISQIITKMYLRYLIKIINANRHIEGFYYSYITSELIRQDEICKIISIQLKKLTIDDRPCFKKINYAFNKQGKKEIIIKCTHLFAYMCRHNNSIIYKSPAGKKFNIKKLSI